MAPHCAPLAESSARLRTPESGPSAPRAPMAVRPSFGQPVTPPQHSVCVHPCVRPGRSPSGIGDRTGESHHPDAVGTSRVGRAIPTPRRSEPGPLSEPGPWGDPGCDVQVRSEMATVSVSLIAHRIRTAFATSPVLAEVQRRGGRATRARTAGPRSARYCGRRRRCRNLDSIVQS